MTESTGETTGAKGPAGLRRTIGLRWIVSGAAALLTIAVVGAVATLTERQTRSALTKELRTRVVFEARNLALTSAGALLSDFPELTLTPILAELRKGQNELAFAMVADREGTILGHADARRIGQKIDLPADLRSLPDVVELSTGEDVLENLDVLVATAPVRHPGSGESIGKAYVAIDRAHVETILAATRRRQLLLTAGLLGGAVIIVLFLMSVLLRPLGALRAGLERIGRGNLESPVRLRDRTELGLLADTMNEMAARIRDAQREHIEKERLSREVELAREIQSSLLPAGGLQRDGVSVAGSHRSALEVGGDFWDVFELPDGRMGIVIADVAGKGLAGCLVTSMLSALLRSFRKTETSPKRLLVRLDEDRRGSLRPGTFITMFYGILDPSSGQLVFASAGHSPLLVRRAGGAAEWYRTTGIPVGVMRGGQLEKSLRDELVELGPGDLAIQYTDGINEAFSPGGEDQFGFGRIEAAVSEACEEGAARGPEEAAMRTLDRVRHDVERWVGDQPPLDDETVVVIARAAAATERAAIPETGPLAELARGKAEGCHLKIEARVPTLGTILERLSHCSCLAGLDSRQKHVLESALYEVCANIVEHGLAGTGGESFDLWWIPPPADEKEGGSRSFGPGRGGKFVLRDGGVPFAPDSGSSVDFRNPKARRKGRGLGLEIIRAAMQSIEYHPGTPEGNVTIMEFNPNLAPVHEEASRGE